MQAYRIETTLQKDGTVVLHHLPFQAGEVVEVIILPRLTESQSAGCYPLRGAAVQYSEPTDPVAQSDWAVEQ